MSAPAIATVVRFQISLTVTDLSRAVHFYRTLLATKPAENGSQQVRFELADPPVVLLLTPGLPTPGGALNHVGLRLPDSAALVEVQRRLEEAGIATQRQEGVECCYARQTKFWVTDPDRNLWELYVLEDDLDHSGFEDAPRPVIPPAAAVVWEHRLTEPVPQRIPHADASVDEVHLEGTCNARRADLNLAALLTETLRVLRPGGKINAHGLVGDRPLEAPTLPGLAGLVQRVPSIAELLAEFAGAGFATLFCEHLHDVTCFQVDGVRLQELRLIGRRPITSDSPGRQRVLYKGPLAQLLDEDGTVYRRGETVEVSDATYQRLRHGPVAEQFLLYPD